MFVFLFTILFKYVYYVFCINTNNKRLLFEYE